MSKLETVKALRDSTHDMPLIEQIQQMRSELSALPSALTETVLPLLTRAEALEREAESRMSTMAKLGRIQRQSLEEMSIELTARAGQEFQRVTTETLLPLQQRLDQLEQVMGRLLAAAETSETTSSQLLQLPAKINQETGKTIKTGKAAAELLNSTANSMQELIRARKLWKTALLVLSMSALGGLIGAAGMFALSSGVLR